MKISAKSASKFLCNTAVRKMNKQRNTYPLNKYMLCIAKPAWWNESTAAYFTFPACIYINFHSLDCNHKFSSRCVRHPKHSSSWYDVV